MGSMFAALIVKVQILSLGTFCVGRHLWIIKFLDFLSIVAMFAIYLYAFIQWGIKEGNCFDNFTVCVFFIKCIISFIGFLIYFSYILACLPCICCNICITCFGASSENLYKLPFNKAYKKQF